MWIRTPVLTGLDNVLINSDWLKCNFHTLPVPITVIIESVIFGVGTSPGPQIWRVAEVYYALRLVYSNFMF